MYEGNRNKEPLCIREILAEDSSFALFFDLIIFSPTPADVKQAPRGSARGVRGAVAVVIERVIL